MSPSSPPTHAQEEILRRLVEQSDSGRGELPSLGPPDWWSTLTDWVRKPLEELWDVVSDMLEAIGKGLLGAGNVHGLMLDTMDLLRWAVVLGCILVGGWIGVLLMRRFEAQRGSLTFSGRDGLEAPTDELFRQMMQGLDARDYALAARFLWRLYVRKHGLVPSLTPIEFSSSEQGRGLMSTLNDLCWLMFSGMGSPEKFAACRQVLLEVEEGG